jgi:aspartyl-tRNA(Asn)/glutamyl-tRNA(Gln) amidotransferase subunit A
VSRAEAADAIDTWRATTSPQYRAEVAAVTLAEAFLDRIARLDDRYHAFITVTPDIAEADARRVDEARRKGKPLPLDGLPVAVKDSIDIAGTPTTVGSSFFKHRVAASDAECMRRLREAGAVVLGKTNMHEFAFGGTTDNPFFGTCRNPWDLQRIPGGSSGGSAAAVAAGLCCGSLGSDTGGSVRIPAALNGVSGMRPTYGLVSSRGVFPLSRTLDIVGPMARTVADVAAMLAVLAGYDELDPRSIPCEIATIPRSTSDGLAGMTIGVPQRFFFDGVDNEVAHAVRNGIDALGELGAVVRAVELPGADVVNHHSNSIIWAEAFALHRTRLYEDPELFGADTRMTLRFGEAVTGAEFADALQGMFEWQRTVSRAFRDVDIIATPATAAVAPNLDDVETVGVTANLVRLTRHWSLAQVPALVVPCGFSSEGLPIGLQLAAAKTRDATLLRAGLEYQAATDWHLRRPTAV